MSGGHDLAHAGFVDYLAIASVHIPPEPASQNESTKQYSIFRARFKEHYQDNRNMTIEDM